MKIAFVGKGGSGKTTLTASFVQFLQKHHIFTLLFDADINVGLSNAVGISDDIYDQSKYLSRVLTATEIRKYLIGANTRIHSPDHMVKTTPPAHGSLLIQRSSADFFRQFCSYETESLKFFHVGTYESEGVGMSCYHTSLSVFENILSHTALWDGQFLVADMVAGNDAFSNTLFSQFDILALIVEPTIESVSMVRSYLELMQQTKSSTKIVILANKIDDTDDLEYLRSQGIEADYVFSYEKDIKTNRRNHQSSLTNLQETVWETFFENLKTLKRNPDQKLEELYELHRKYIQLDYIRTPLGDLSDQIDLHFSFSCIAELPQQT